MQLSLNPAISEALYVLRESHSLHLMQAKLEHANHILAKTSDATESDAVESKLTKAPTQQAQHDGLITTSVSAPAEKLARHNSSPLLTQA